VAIWEHDHVSTAPPWNSKITAAAAVRTNTHQDRLSASSQQALIPGCGPSIDDVQGTHQHPLGALMTPRMKRGMRRGRESTRQRQRPRERHHPRRSRTMPELLKLPNL
jgi:hypothetical protein